jgi:hypothetical protein
VPSFTAVAGKLTAKESLPPQFWWEFGPPARQRILPEYNVDSEKRPVIREVSADSTQFNFDIK